MAMPMCSKENSAEKFIEIGRNFSRNCVLTAKKCPFISGGERSKKRTKKGAVLDRKMQIKKYENVAKRG